MATSSSGRQSRRSVNTLGQEELRRLMRAKQRESTAGKRKIDSPYVRYNSLGNLSCCLCNVTVKNELLWQTHVLGKQHKENIKYSTSKSFTETSSPLKKKKLEPRILDQKKGQDCNDHQPQAVSSNLPKTFFDKIEQTEVEIISSKSSSVVLLGNYKTEEGKKEDMTKEIRERDSKTSLPTPAQYELSSDLVPKAELVACSSTVNVKKQEKVKPANKAQPTSTVDLLECLHKWASTPGQNYLENNALATPQLSHSESVQKAEPQEKNHQRRENTAEALPEGFFDDPEVDAKVRKVDTPKDQMDKEWDEFQKAMRQINTISEAIVAEEDEEGRLDRQIGEIDEQIECFRRVEQLRDRQEIRKDQLKEAMSQTVTQTKEDDDIDSNDEDELQDLLSQDWRAKGTIL